MNKYPGELRPTVRSSEIVVWEWECFINFKEGDAISPKSRRSARVRSRKFPGKPRENEKHSSAALTHAIIQEIDDSIFVFRVRNFYAQLWNPNFQKEHNNRCYYYNGGAPLKDSSLSKKSREFTTESRIYLNIRPRDCGAWCREVIRSQQAWSSSRRVWRSICVLSSGASSHRQRQTSADRGGTGRSGWSGGRNCTTRRLCTLWRSSCKIWLVILSVFGAEGHRIVIRQWVARCTCVKSIWQVVELSKCQYSLQILSYAD